MVREAARNTGSVMDATWQQALDVGWTEQELSDTYAHVALNLFTNYFNHYAAPSWTLNSLRPAGLKCPVTLGLRSPAGPVDSLLCRCLTAW